MVFVRVSLPLRCIDADSASAALCTRTAPTFPKEGTSLELPKHGQICASGDVSKRNAGAAIASASNVTTTVAAAAIPISGGTSAALLPVSIALTIAALSTKHGASLVGFFKLKVPEAKQRCTEALQKLRKSRTECIAALRHAGMLEACGNIQNANLEAWLSDIHSDGESQEDNNSSFEELKGGLSNAAKDSSQARSKVQTAVEAVEEFEATEIVKCGVEPASEASVEVGAELAAGVLEGVLDAAGSVGEVTAGAIMSVPSLIAAGRAVARGVKDGEAARKGRKVARGDQESCERYIMALENVLKLENVPARR